MPPGAGGAVGEGSEHDADQQRQEHKGDQAEGVQAVAGDAGGALLKGGPPWRGQQFVEVDGDQQQQDESDAAGRWVKALVQPPDEAAPTRCSESEPAEPAQSRPQVENSTVNTSPFASHARPKTRPATTLISA